MAIIKAGQMSEGYREHYTSDNIKAALMCYWRFARRSSSMFCTELQMQGYIADFAVIQSVFNPSTPGSPLHELHEIEIKITKQDFLKDFTHKAGKHARYAGTNEAENADEAKYPMIRYHKPNYFSYCAPPPLWEFIRDYIREHNLPYGLFLVDFDERGMPSNSVCMVLKAKKLTDEPTAYMSDVQARMASDYADLSRRVEVKNMREYLEKDVKE